jgi:DNA-binding NarL/FixJ family response regulator
MSRESDPSSPSGRPGALDLTDRELDVVNSVCAGLSNKAIARKLGISCFTVQDHVKAIYRKLNVNSRVALMNFIRGPQTIVAPLNRGMVSQGS